MKKCPLLASFLISFLIPLTTYAAPLKEASKELKTLNTITGFHSHIFKKSGFEFKIFEVDGSSSVALNPVYLYLGIVNLQSPDESIILELPNVSKVLSVTFSPDTPTIMIDTRMDIIKDGEIRSHNLPRTIKIEIPLKKDALPKKVEAEIINKHK